MLHGVRKYTECAIGEEKIRRCRPYAILQKLELGGKMTEEEEFYISDRVMYNGIFKNGIPLGGWFFGFGRYLKRFLVRQHDEWEEVWGVNQKIVCRLITGYVDEIYEIPR